MRKTRLMTATALALTLSGLPALALADTTISTETTTPVNTGTTGKLTVAPAGSFKLTSGTAVTVDSNSDVILNGNINMASSASDSTGILIDGGRTSNLTVAGKLTITDNFTSTDKGDKNGSTADGLIDPPFAEGTGRYGIHSRGTTAFVGNVNIQRSSELFVDGDESHGVRFENRIDGKFTIDGNTVIAGNNSTGITLEDGVSGTVFLSGDILVRGEDSSAVKLSGDFGDSVLIDGRYISTAYWTPTPTEQQIENARPDNKIQGGPTVEISGNVANGIWLSGVVAGTVADNNDEDGNGIDDIVQTLASLTSYGQAPALLVGSATEDLTIGAIAPKSTAVIKPTINYGLYIQGEVQADGVFPGISATALQTGGRGHAVNIANGIGITGPSVRTRARNANATSVALLSGTNTPRLDVTSAISSEITSNGDHSTRAIFIDAGANVSTLNVNTGSSVLAQSTGSKTRAAAVTDLSGTLTTITNRASIEAHIIPSDEDGDGVADTRVHTSVAIDVRANTTGVTLTQIDPAPADTDDDKKIPPPVIKGDILFGSGNDIMRVNGGSVEGNIDFGLGNDSLAINKASVVGNVSFGAGTNSFTVENGAAFAGRVTSTGTVNVAVSDSYLGLLDGSSINAGTFSVDSKSTLSVMLDTETPGSAPIKASGAVTFAEGAKLNLFLNNVLLEPERFTVFTGSSIDMGSITSANLLTNTPWIYAADLVENSTNTALYADFRLKSQSELSMSNNEYAAFDPILGIIAADSGASNEVLNRLSREDFHAVYNQYLPDHSGENLITLSRGSQALNRTLSDLTVIPSNTGGQYWLHEETFNTERDYGDVNGFEAGGFVLSGGRERAFGSHNMAGVYISFVTSTPYDSFSIAGEKLVNSDMTIGAYWRYNKDNMRMWAHGGAGYVSLESNRELLTESFSHRTTAKWNGGSITAGAGAAYDYKMGSFLFGPKVMIGYYGLKEDAYKEVGGGQYFDLSVEDRDSHLLSGTALLNVTFDRWFIKPEAWVGWKQNISADVSPTVAAFQNGNSFALSAGDIEGGGPIAGFRVRADNAWSYFAIEAEYEDVGPYKAYSLSLKTRFQF